MGKSGQGSSYAFMPEGTKLELDRRDFSRICAGLEACAKLDAKDFTSRLAAHKNEVFCNVAGYDGTGMLMCTRDGYDAIIELAQRLQGSMPVPDDYSVKELVDGIR